MPSIHPSEDPPLGWLVPCLAVKDLEASMAFYAALDLLPLGGDPAEGWSVLRHRAVELHLFSKHIEKDVLNFRGGDVPAIQAVLATRGLHPRGEEAFAARTYVDPDGREVFFDCCPETEAPAYRAGQVLTLPIDASDVHAGEGLDLGNLTWCCACNDLAATSAFYETLGLVPSGGDPESGWSILARRDHPPRPGTRLVTTYLTLFQSGVPADVLSLRGGHVGAIAHTLAERGIDLGEGVQTAEDGGESLLLHDPDGRGVFLDTTPPERLYEA